MMMRDVPFRSGCSFLNRVIPALATGVILFLGTPVWAEDAPASPGADASSGSSVSPAGSDLPPSPLVIDPSAPATSSVPGVTEAAPPVLKPPEAKAGPAPSGEFTGAVGPTPYVGPVSVTSIGAFGSEFVTDQPIVIPRSGGLAPLLFENKLGNWLNVKLSVAQSYDSNVFLNSYKQDDFITRVSPAIAFQYSNQLLDWNLGTSLDYRYYAKNTRTEDFNYSLNTGGRIKVYRDYAFIIVSDTFTQTSQSNSVNYSSLSPTVNVTNLNTLRVNPRLELPITSKIKFNPQVAYTNYWYPSQNQQNRQNYAASADFSYELSRKLSPYLGYSFNRMDGQLQKYDQHYPYFGIRFLVDELTLQGSVGYSMLTVDNGGSTSHMVWNANLAYRLATTTYTLATASDVDQSAFLNNTTVYQLRKAPQIVTSYSGSFQKEFRKSILTLSLYFRENTDSITSDLITRTFGTSGSLNHTLSARLSGVFSYRVERGDQRNSVVGVLTNQGTHSLLYELGYRLAYSFGKEWITSCEYRYLNSSSPQAVSTYNYTDNRVSLAVSKTF
jgi:hypothetical protein